jgi:hypothetical protein
MLELVPISLAEAKEFIGQEHRHHAPPIGHKFSIGVQNEGKLVGVVVVGRPVARGTDFHIIAEVTRLATDGTKNACSILYAAAARAAQAMGYKKIQTFILDNEPGTSLKAAGWIFDGMSAPTNWDNRPNRKLPDHLRGLKQRWIKEL